MNVVFERREHRKEEWKSWVPSEASERQVGPPHLFEKGRALECEYSLYKEPKKEHLSFIFQILKVKTISSLESHCEHWQWCI